jgi:hypothetical protein
MMPVSNLVPVQTILHFKCFEIMTILGVHLDENELPLSGALIMNIIEEKPF